MEKQRTKVIIIGFTAILVGKLFLQHQGYPFMRSQKAEVFS